mmetsp:Transcript_27100/g.108520  ORF Transcript_27100/g.108520 Transcript_27100/m.108520 type:complete len:215 (-) Transcript_27100:680-1324(-)
MARGVVVVVEPADVRVCDAAPRPRQQTRARVVAGRGPPGRVGGRVGAAAAADLRSGEAPRLREPAVGHPRSRPRRARARGRVAGGDRGGPGRRAAAAPRAGPVDVVRRPAARRVGGVGDHGGDRRHVVRQGDLAAAPTAPRHARRHARPRARHERNLPPDAARARGIFVVVGDVVGRCERGPSWRRWRRRARGIDRVVGRDGRDVGRGRRDQAV